MTLLDEMQELALIERMKLVEEDNVERLREKVGELDKATLAAMRLMYRTGWTHCIRELRRMRGRL